MKIANKVANKLQASWMKLKKHISSKKHPAAVHHPHHHNHHLLPLPYEILIDVLSRLPVDSVLQCKLVCKAWHALIEDDHAAFRNLHTQYYHSSLTSMSNIDNPSLRSTVDFLLFSDGEGGDRIIRCGKYDNKLKAFEVSQESITGSHDYWSFINGYLVGSCNGLICFSSRKKGEQFWVCNPFTREYVILPRSEKFEVPAEHPPRELVAIGFGYHPSTNEYKVVMVHSDGMEGHVQVYTLGSQQWRIKTYLAPVTRQQLNIDKFRGTYYNGSLYWLDNYGAVFRFDLGDEELTSVPWLGIPESPKNGNGNLRAIRAHLRVMGERLCLIEGNDHSVLKMGIWQLNKQQTSWRNFVKCQHRVPPNHSSRSVWLEPLAILERGQTLIKYDCTRCLEQQLLLYNPETDRFGFVEQDYQPQYIEMIPYMKSYISLKALGEEDAVQVPRSAGKPSSDVRENAKPLSRQYVCIPSSDC